MPGLEHIDGIDAVVAFLMLVVVPLLMLGVVLTGIGGCIYWAARRSLPQRRFVRACMWGTALIGVAVVVAVGGYWLDRLRYPL